MSITGPSGVVGDVCIRSGGRLSMTGGSFSTNVRLDSGATFQQRGGGKRGTVFRPPSPEAGLSQKTDAEAAAANAEGLACTLGGAKSARAPLLSW